MKDLLNWDAILEIAKIAGPVGIVVIGLGIAAVFIVKSKGWTGFGDKTKMIASSRIDKIDSTLSLLSGQVGEVKIRLKDVERDLEERPTRDDIHKLDLAMVRQDERLKSIDRGIQATNVAVTSINDFMREASLHLNEDRPKGDRK